MTYNQETIKLSFAALAAMIFQDIICVLMVQAEARNHGWLAGSMDSVQWLFGLFTAFVTITALQGHKRSRKYALIAFVTCGNLIGSEIGVLIGQQYIK